MRSYFDSMVGIHQCGNLVFQLKSPMSPVKTQDDEETLDISVRRLVNFGLVIVSRRPDSELGL